MKFLTLTVAAATLAIAANGGAGLAYADGAKAPTVMTDAQMDTVTAGRRYRTSTYDLDDTWGDGNGEYYDRVPYGYTAKPTGCRSNTCRNAQFDD